MTKFEYYKEMESLVTKRASFDGGVTKEIFLNAAEGFAMKAEKLTVLEAAEEISKEQEGYLKRYREIIDEYEANT